MTRAFFIRGWALPRLSADAARLRRYGTPSCRLAGLRLPINGLAFPLDNSALLASLDVTRLLLLSWVGTVSVLVARREPPQEEHRPAVAG